MHKFLCDSFINLLQNRWILNSEFGFYNQVVKNLSQSQRTAGRQVQYNSIEFYVFLDILRVW